MLLSYRVVFNFNSCEATMEELSYVGITFTVVILGLACFMAAKLASKSAYH
ncbi:MAG: hypothetical protein IPF44_05770 [Betaproteobacteria bacterium]|nr:hypothetical protein [Betaproteobacteria bacterium]MBK6356254.1 hypothetical protein [Betaproteobacteria bacterium]